MLKFACFQIILILAQCDASRGLSAFTPRPRDSQGFQLPLDVTISHKQQQAKLGAAKNLATLDMSDTREFTYLVPISIGDQDFMVTLDTASSDLWVASSDCKDPDCQAVQTYKKSSTLSLTQAPFEVKYVKGTVSGTIGYETVTLGTVQVSEQILGGVVTNVSSINLSDMRNSGILGLAFPVSSAIGNNSPSKTFLENLYDALDENSRFFTFKLGRGPSPSFFTIGQVNSSLLSNASLSYFPVYPSNAYGKVYDYWKLPLHHINVNGSPLPFPLSPSRVKGSASPIAVLDTGTSLMLGPVQDVDALWQAAVGGGGGTRDPQSGLWMIPCDRAISASFVFGGVDGVEMHEYFVHPDDLSWNGGGTQSGNQCLAGIQGNDKVISGDWLLGDAFLRNVYATHHAATTRAPPLIGLASLTDPATAMSDFNAERGPDSAGGPINFVSQRRKTHSSAPFLLFSAAAGFASGLVVLLALKLNVCRRIAGRKKLFY